MNADLILLLVVSAFRSQGASGIERALTPSQKAIRAFPGRKNADVFEIQEQFKQAAQQYAQAIEAIYNKDFVDPDSLLNVLTEPKG